MKDIKTEIQNLVHALSDHHAPQVRQPGDSAPTTTAGTRPDAAGAGLQ